MKRFVALLALISAVGRVSGQGEESCSSNVNTGSVTTEEAFSTRALKFMTVSHDEPGIFGSDDEIAHLQARRRQRRLQRKEARRLQREREREQLSEQIAS